MAAYNSLCHRIIRLTPILSSSFLALLPLEYLLLSPLRNRASQSSSPLDLSLDHGDDGGHLECRQRHRRLAPPPEDGDEGPAGLRRARHRPPCRPRRRRREPHLGPPAPPGPAPPRQVFPADEAGAAPPGGRRRVLLAGRRRRSRRVRSVSSVAPRPPPPPPSSPTPKKLSAANRFPFSAFLLLLSSRLGKRRWASPPSTPLWSPASSSSCGAVSSPPGLRVGDTLVRGGGVLLSELDRRSSQACSIPSEENYNSVLRIHFSDAFYFCVSTGTLLQCSSFSVHPWTTDTLVVVVISGPSCNW
ncbi:hypothetical protein BHM03_00029034 [Ensete ventricosum]|nr:hypothetical protein BHM03_00029034 [Ensete ventricosum]